MVLLLIASLIAGLGFLFYRSRMGAGTSNAAVKTPDQYETMGGISFLVKPGTDTQAAINAGATSYDINDPATAARTKDAIARATNLEAYAKAQGNTVEGLYQAHLQQDVAAGHMQASGIASYSAKTSGFVPKTNADLSQAMDAQIPIMGPQPPGKYWDYGTQSWQWMPV